MVKEKITTRTIEVEKTITLYICEICGYGYESKEEAEVCERKKPTKIGGKAKEGSYGYLKTRYPGTWEIGDFVVFESNSFYSSGYGKILAQIVGSTAGVHEEYPIVKIILPLDLEGEMQPIREDGEIRTVPVGTNVGEVRAAAQLLNNIMSD